MNPILPHRLVNIESQCWANAQFSRWDCLDIIGIPGGKSCEHV